MTPRILRALPVCLFALIVGAPYQRGSAEIDTASGLFLSASLVGVAALLVAGLVTVVSRRARA